ncbi:hypothetical protein [Paractinoplanes maris]|uniref:hypothetical protein n=1 Tax=Paractinoplanes maris TaxID=1734446 RepID=UPI0020203B11|nr:hypothetical protein [Actinoplanes maris]
MAELDHTVDRRWENGHGATIEIGTAGEKWFAWHSRKGDAWVFIHERAQADLADQWLARGVWRETTDALVGQSARRDAEPQGEESTFPPTSYR